MADRRKECIYNEIDKIKSSDLERCQDDELKSLSVSLRAGVLHGESRSDLRTAAFSLVFHAIKRSLRITPFDVQIEAAISMTEGNIIELPTGEGKTIVAVFVAYYHALSGRGVHVLTFNDFLAKRDALWMQPVYELLGVSVDYITAHKMRQQRKAAYQADITYLTVKEAGYDYLRSFLAYDPAHMVQRPFHMAIIDEADSIMIDNARIPLIVAGDTKNKITMDRHIYDLVSTLKEQIHYKINHDTRTISLTEEGYRFFEKEVGEDLYDAETADILTTIFLFLKAEFLLRRDIDYIVKNNEILIIDEFTGRIMSDCKWSEGIQTAVEIKENLVVTPQETIMNRITIQNFLQRYPHLCGMTGTARSAASEFEAFYHKSVDVIPPDKPCVRVDHPDIIFSNEAAKQRAIIEKIKQLHQTGRPVLIGTGSIRESEELAAALKEESLDMRVLNAKNDEEEAAIIADAGKLKAVTISTNMAGRGVDIQLGGSDKKQYQQVAALGGLFVIGTNRHDSVRIDHQLRGRSGRQGDPGESVFYISLEDTIFMKHSIRAIIPGKRKQDDCEPITNKAVRKAVAHVQKAVEGQALDAKIALSKYSLVYEQQRRIAHQMRERVMNDRQVIGNTTYFKADVTDRVSSAEMSSALKAITLYAINSCWANHLLHIENTLDEIQLIGRFTSDPFDYFNHRLIEYFSTFEADIHDKIVSICENTIVKDDHIDLEMMGIEAPASTKTYMLLDGTENMNLINEFAAVANPLTAFLYLVYMIFAYFWERQKRKSQS